MITNAVIRYRVFKLLMNLLRFDKIVEDMIKITRGRRLQLIQPNDITSILFFVLR